MRHRLSGPGSTAETPNEQCKHHQHGESTRIRVILIGLVRVVRVIFRLIGRRGAVVLKRLVWVTRAPVAAAFAPRATGGVVTCEGSLRDRSRIPEVGVLRSRNQKREKQNADGRE